MMKLIADSGSTKTDWRLIESGKLLFEFESVGLNPFFNTENDVKDVLASLDLIVDNKTNIQEVYFYGAGCSDETHCQIIYKAFNKLLPNAQINVEHDLLAAARSTCQGEVGIACILGTGSNSCLYDGEKIIKNVPALGYILGDEGSGTDISKHFLRAFFYDELPKNIVDSITNHHNWNKHDLLEHLYEKSFPNRYLASLTEIVKKYIDEPFVFELVKSCFNQFLFYHVAKYKGATKYPINFVGSIAFEFKDILAEALTQNGMQLGKIIKKPIDELVKYHS